MRPDGPARDDVRCIELVELLTAYLDDELVTSSADGSTRISPDAKAAALRSTSSDPHPDHQPPHDGGCGRLDPLIRDRLMSTLQIPGRR